MKMRNLLNLLKKEATRKTAVFLRSGLCKRAWGDWSLSLEDAVVSDKRLDFCYFLCGAFKIGFCVKGLTVDFESLQVLACLCQEQENNNASCFLPISQVFQVYLVTVRTSFRLSLTS